MDEKIKKYFEDFCREFLKKDSSYKKRYIELFKKAFVESASKIIFEDNGFHFNVKDKEMMPVYYSEVYIEEKTNIPVNINNCPDIESLLEINDEEYGLSYDFDFSYYWKDVEKYANEKFEKEEMTEEEMDAFVEHADFEWMPDEFYDYKEELLKVKTKDILTDIELSKFNTKDYYKEFRKLTHALYFRESNLDIGKRRLFVTLSAEESIFVKEGSFASDNWEYLPEFLVSLMTRTDWEKPISLIIRENTGLKDGKIPISRISGFVFFKDGISFISSEKLRASFDNPMNSEVFMDSKQHLSILGLIDVVDAAIEFI